MSFHLRRSATPQPPAAAERAGPSPSLRTGGSAQPPTRITSLDCQLALARDPDLSEPDPSMSALLTAAWRAKDKGDNARARVYLSLVNHRLNQIQSRARVELYG